MGHYPNMESGLCKATRMISRGGPCRKLGNASRSSLDGEISLQKKGGNALESALPRDTYWGLLLDRGARAKDNAGLTEEEIQRGMETNLSCFPLPWAFRQ